MKVKVLLDYVDKYTYVYNKVGQIIEMTEERLEEINKKRTFVEKIDKKPTKKRKSRKKDIDDCLIVEGVNIRESQVEENENKEEE